MTIFGASKSVNFRFTRATLVELHNPEVALQNQEESAVSLGNGRAENPRVR